MTYLILISISYLCGSIPFGIIVSRHFGAGDLRLIGSGNIGASNAWRAGGKKVGIITFLCDMTKTLLPSMIAREMFDLQTAGIVSFTCIFGHIFPVWLKFKGGKGAAPALGMLITMTPLLSLLSASAWLITIKISKFASLASITTLFLSFLLSFFYESSAIHITYAAASVLIIFTHRRNISNLINKTELRFK